jgi:hypothetical protein
MIKWEDDFNKHGEIVSTRAKIGMFKIVIHRYTGYPPDQWFLSCYGLFEMVKLHPKDIKLAKIQATAKFQIILEEAIKDIIGDA